MFLFCGEDVFKKVESLSGGERAKLSLLKIMLSKPNFLILDEPTNHLDIVSREVLENALSDFDGTLLVVSHDRYSINKLATRTVYLTNEGAVNIDGNYDSYLAYKEREALKTQTKNAIQKPIVNDYKLRKEKASNERKRLTRITRIEAEIEETESQISTLEEELSTPEVSGNYERLLEYTERLDSLRSSLDALYEEWEDLQTEQE
jgi:ATP-binding cassette subfamily F protein 3